MMATVFGYDSLFLGHSSIYNTIVGICNIINLDVDFVSPSCLLSAGIWKYVRMSLCCILRMAGSIPLVQVCVWLLPAAHRPTHPFLDRYRV